MLIWLADWLTQFDTGFNVFSYLTLRAILSTLTALLIAILIGPKMIRYLQTMQIGQTVRDDGPQSHLSKSGTPTMGGLLILAAIVVSVLLWADLSNRYVLVTLAVVVSYGIIGFVDDYRKVIRKDSKGLIARWKYFWQSVVAIGVAFFLYSSATLSAISRFTAAPKRPKASLVSSTYTTGMETFTGSLAIIALAPAFSALFANSWPLKFSPFSAR